MAPVALNFDQLEERVKQIFNRAEARLDQILTDCSHSTLNDLFTSCDQSGLRNGTVEYELRLGSTSLSLEEIHALKTGSILPLLDSEQGRVQIVLRGQVCGKGVLLVVDGKLALRVESINSTL